MRVSTVVIVLVIFALGVVFQAKFSGVTAPVLSRVPGLG